MTRNAQDIIDDMRNIVKPRIAKMLLETNFEGCGKEDKAEFETEFEIILILAEKTLEQEPILDKIKQAREEIENEVKFWSEPCRYNVRPVINAGIAKAQSYKHCLEIIDKLIAENEVEE